MTEWMRRLVWREAASISSGLGLLRGRGALDFLEAGFARNAKAVEHAQRGWEHVEFHGLADRQTLRGGRADAGSGRRGEKKAAMSQADTITPSIEIQILPPIRRDMMRLMRITKLLPPLALSMTILASAAEVIVNGRPSVVLESPAAKLVIDLGGGSIVDFHLAAEGLKPAAVDWRRGRERRPAPDGPFPLSRSVGSALRG
jgi:hypothetical protein